MQTPDLFRNKNFKTLVHFTQIMEMLAFIFLMLLFCSLTPTTASSSDVISSGCPDTCGNIRVPYPFAVNDTSSSSVNPECALIDTFMFLCNSTENPPQLYLGNLQIRNISLEEGTITVRTFQAYDCYNDSGLVHRSNYRVTLGGQRYPFRFSHTRNKLTAVGCDTLAFMTDTGGTFGSGCVSLCSENKILEDCSGIGCCQTAVPKSLKTLNITILSPNSHSNVWQFNPCGFAFLTEDKTFNVSNMRLSDYSNPNPTTSRNVVLEWVVREVTCEDAQSSSNPYRYACGNNANCTYSENGMGYRCLCKTGFTGNPYLPQGCQDIDECKEPKNYTCEGSCKNTIGNYTCRCALGMRGDGKRGCQGFRVTTIATVGGAVAFVVIISFLIVIIWKKIRKERNFLENGGMLLKHQRVRLFSEAELVKATKNYDASRFLGEGGFGSVYKGILEGGTLVAVKKPKDLDKTRINQEFQKELGIVSQVNHINVVKIAGLCLETKLPLLVYEFISNGSLFQHIHQKKSQILADWKNRLRIAAETALALDYLHSLANPPIIHGDVKSANILLDDNYTAKVSDFGASVLVSPGQNDMATKIQGTFGYLDPEYLMTGILTEKSDVYSFGVVLVELLTGEKPNCNARSGSKSNIVQYFLSLLERNNLSEILGFMVTEDEEDEVFSFAGLAKKCLSSSGENRPSMKAVAEELSRLRKLNESLWAQQNSNETERLLGGSSHHLIDMENARMNQTDSL